MSKKDLVERFKELEEIRDKGYLVFVKLDGEREVDVNTIVISSLKTKSQKEILIQFHGSDLLLIMERAINKFNESEI